MGAAYESQSRAVCADLATALKANRSRRSSSRPRSAQSLRRPLSDRSGNATRADTRAARIAKFVGMLERGEKLHP